MKVRVKRLYGSSAVPMIGYSNEKPVLGHSMTVFFPGLAPFAKFLRTSKVTAINDRTVDGYALVHTEKGSYGVTALEVEQITEA